MRTANLLLLGLAAMMLTPFVPVPNATAHDCGSLLLTPWCNGGDCPPDGDHYHRNDAPPAWCRSTGVGRNCPPQATHTYGSGGSAGYDSQTAQRSGGAGIVTVWHTNPADCNGDGIPGGWDGDYENGVGGAFFGWGFWANEPQCQYGLNVHGGNVAVNDAVFGSNVQFVVGEDDQNGPIIITDPVSGDVIDCETDGSISPGTDADDCISPVYTGTGSTCGPGGGDGGFWVFLSGAEVTENGGVSTSNPPTTGFITAY